MNKITNEQEDDTCCKVDHLISKYDISGANEWLTEEWQGENGQDSSIRELTEEFNKQVLQATLDRGNVNYLEGEIENTLRLLTDKDVTESVRINVRRALKRADVEIEAAEKDFISHQTLYNHLTRCLGASKPQNEPRNPIDKHAEAIFSLQNRTVAVVDSKLDQLSSQNHLDLADFEVYVDIQVLCRECETSQNLGNMLRDGGCPCQQDE